MGKRPVTFAAIRAAELTTLLHHRHGRGALPCDDAGMTAARVLVHHLARLRDAPRRISDWLNRYAPWLDLASRERLIRDATECPIKWSADKIAWKLRVTIDERITLRLKSIGAISTTAAQRIAATTKRKVAAKRQQRRDTGAKPRAAYEANSLARSKPWLALGISRATYYRRMRRP